MSDGVGQTLKPAAEAAVPGDVVPGPRAGATSRRRTFPVGGLIRTAVVTAFIYLTWYQSTDFIGVLGLAAIWGIATVGLGLVLGAAGQISLCQASFVLVGAYMYGTVATEWSGPTLIGLIASMAAGAIAAFLVSPILRARGYYLAIATMAVALLIDRIAVTASWIPGGNAGIIGVPTLKVFGYSVNDENSYLTVALVLLAFSILVLHLRYGRGRRRREIQALHHDEDLLAGFGGHSSRLKREVFVVGGMLAGLAGGLYAGDFGYVSNQGFGLVESFALALAVFIGGEGRLMGAALGALIYQASFVVLGNTLVDYRFALLGAIVVITVHLFPRGLMPSIQDFEGWIPDWRGRSRAQAGDRAHHELDAVDPIALRVGAITKRFGALTAVNDVSLEVRPGSLTALIGPNGAGKTTLLDMIAGEQFVTVGRVFLDGRDVTDRDRAYRARRGISRTYQRIRLVSSLSVLDNVLVGVDHAARGELHVSEAERRRRAEAALLDVGLGDRHDADVSSLTFGQRRLVEMARAIASRPRLVLLDEPSSGLNDGEIDGFANVIRRLHSTGCTVLLVEHNLPFVRSLAEDIIALDRGALLAYGGTEQVFANADFQRSYVGEAAPA
jgi:branched-chain amino acid transport system permease protein